MKHGFDLTTFDGNWPALCAETELNYSGRGECEFYWMTNSGVFVVTQNNPETGEYGPGRDRRDDEVGFASYIGIEGPDAAVTDFVGAVIKHAAHIKAESPGTRSFI